MDSEYYPKATTRIVNLLKQTFGEDRFTWWDGRPNEDLPEAAFPACIVHKIDGEVTLGATGQDVMRSQINIHFLLNQSDDVNASGEVNVTQNKLERIVEGREAGTGRWMRGTALHALRTNISLENTSIELNADVHYDVTPRPELPSITEAIIQVITRETIEVLDRN